MEADESGVDDGEAGEGVEKRMVEVRDEGLAVVGDVKDGLLEEGFEGRCEAVVEGRVTDVVAGTAGVGSL